MKKIYYLLMGIVTILITVLACENSSMEDDELQMFQKGDVLLQKGGSAPKVTICHYDNYLGESYQITISTNGLNGHDGHVNDNLSPVDTDGDGIMDCADCAINDPDLTASMKKMWYYDGDGDGYGNPDVYIKTCEVREGYVADNTDCDDTLDTVYPGAPELQDGLDNDCDGLIDNNTFGDCDDGKLIYSPEGTYVFRFYGTWDHDYIIDSFDGTNFSGTGGYPAGDPAQYRTWEKIEGTVIDGNLVGLITFLPGSYDGEYSFEITGTVSECDGIVSVGSGWELVE